MILPRKTNKWYFDQVDSLQKLVDIHVQSWKAQPDGYEPRFGESSFDKQQRDLEDSFRGWVEKRNKSSLECSEVFEVQMGKMGDILRSFKNWDFQNTEEGLKSITIMGHKLITEKEEIIKKFSAKKDEELGSYNPNNPLQVAVVDELKWVISEHDNHRSSLAKFLWNLMKDETWWQEKNKEPESKDDLKQCFAVLDSKETDSPEEIKAKFRELIKFYHPDNFQNNPEKRAFAEKKTKELNNAYDKLHERGIL